MATFHIESSNTSFQSRDVEAGSYSKEGVYFTFWQEPSPGGTRVLTVRFSDVKSIEMKR